MKDNVFPSPINPEPWKPLPLWQDIDKPNLVQITVQEIPAGVKSSVQQPHGACLEIRVPRHSPNPFSDSYSLSTSSTKILPEPWRGQYGCPPTVKHPTASCRQHFDQL